MADVDLFGSVSSPTRAMGSHQQATSGSDVWLTPPDLLAALGQFDLDPCAAPEPRPWPTASTHIGAAEDGLRHEWSGRVWLNPPYSRADLWLSRLAEHGCGTALIFARTETALWHRHVWPHAEAILFLRGRLHFHHQDGRRAAANAGAPSVLVAYGEGDADALRNCGIPGVIVSGWRSDPVRHG